MTLTMHNIYKYIYFSLDLNKPGLEQADAVCLNSVQKNQVKSEDTMPV